MSYICSVKKTKSDCFFKTQVKQLKLTIMIKMSFKNEAVAKAVTMMDKFDWYWTYEEYNYSKHEKEAETRMRAFVAQAASCGEEANEILRNAWKYTFKYFRQQRGTNLDEYNKQLEEILKPLVA